MDNPTISPKSMADRERENLFRYAIAGLPDYKQAQVMDYVNHLKTQLDEKEAIIVDWERTMTKINSTLQDILSRL
jgi:hypothetical protein